MSFQKKIVYYNKNAELPYDFNWETYVSLHKDLEGFSEIKAKQHYLLFGQNEKRSYKYEYPSMTRDDFLNVNTFENNNEMTSSIDSSNTDTDLKYQIINEVHDDNYVINDLWCHVHTNNPSQVIDNELFIKVAKYFSIVFTCDNKLLSNIPKDFTILCVDNKSNIDTKKFVVQYLIDKKYNHDLLITMTY